jgi:hypothetical protein
MINKIYYCLCLCFVAVNQLIITSSSRQTLQPPSCQSQSWGLLGVHPSHLQIILSSLAIPLLSLFLGLLRLLEARLGFNSSFYLGHSSDRSVRELGSLHWPLYLVLTAFPFSSTSVFLRFFFPFCFPKADVTRSDKPLGLFFGSVITAKLAATFFYSFYLQVLQACCE